MSYRVVWYSRVTRLLCDIFSIAQPESQLYNHPEYYNKYTAHTHTPNIPLNSIKFNDVILVLFLRIYKKAKPSKNNEKNKINRSKIHIILG